MIRSWLLPALALLASVLGGPASAQGSGQWVAAVEGKSCVTMVNRKQAEEHYSDRSYRWTRFDVDVLNSCGEEMRVRLVTNKGWEEPDMFVPPGQSRHNYCYTGSKVNRDCDGYRDLLVWTRDAPAPASAANCDPVELSEDQKYQLQVCSSHAGCRGTLAIWRACTQVKTFLVNLQQAVVGGGRAFTAAAVQDDDVRRARTALETGTSVAAASARPDPLAALPRRSGAGDGSDLLAQTLARGQRGEALDDKTLPGRGGAAAAGSASGDASAQALAGVFQTLAQGSPRASSNPVLAGLLQGMRMNNPEATSTTTNAGGTTAESDTTGPAAAGAPTALPSESGCKAMFDAAASVMQRDANESQDTPRRSANPDSVYTVALYNWRMEHLRANPACASDAATMGRARESLEQARKYCIEARGANCSSGIFALRTGAQLTSALAEALKTGSAAGTANARACNANVAKAEADFTAMRMPNSTMETYALTSYHMRKLSEAWAPCDAAKSRQYAQQAAETRRSCEQVASNPAACRR